MSRVFISYRREDSAGYAGRINGQLERVVGKANVFQDVTDIAPGKRWETAIGDAVARCDIQLVIIGPRFLDETNGPRLHRHDDFLRQEIKAGLGSASTVVVPVRVGGAALPSAAELPDDLSELITRQDTELHDRSFDRDVRDLLRRLRLRRRKPMAIAGSGLGIFAVLAGVILFMGSGSEGGPTTTEAVTTLAAASATSATPSVTTSSPTTTTAALATTTSPLVTTSSQAVPEPFALESYVGIDADAAQTSLESFGLSVRRSLEGSPTVAAGRVIRHDPEAGASVEAGDVIEVVISSGPPDVEVPGVAEVLADTAVLLLANEGFEVNTRLIVSGLIGAGRAIRTSPPQGTTVAAGSSIDLFVSSGPAPGCTVLFANDRARIGLSFSISQDESGNPTGFDIGAIQAVIDQMCGLDVTEVYISLTARQRFTALTGGEIDVLLTANSSRDYDLLYTTPYVLLDGETPRGMAIRANRSDERLELNAALLEVIDSGRWLELHRGWLGEPGYEVKDMLATPLPEA